MLEIVTTSTIDGPGPDPAITSAVCAALRSVSANDDICKQVSAAGGTRLALQLLRLGAGDAELARASASLLRQLASSDAVKAEAVGGGVLEAVAVALEAHGADAAMAEPALGLVTNVTLRNPEAAERAVEGGAAAAVLSTLRGALGRGAGANAAAQGVAKQACMALRNIASRSLDARAGLLGLGAEATLRATRGTWPASEAAEAASAALRDLGAE